MKFSGILCITELFYNSFKFGLPENRFKKNKNTALTVQVIKKQVSLYVNLCNKCSSRNRL